jgi:RNA polymerase subunit RPABC4/transcription elongation factor Spt4
MANKICLNCGLKHPDTADFCPECGRPIEDAIRVESEVKKSSTTNVATGCLYCGLQLPDSPDFCPECGRPIERGLKIRPNQESELDCPHEESKGKETPIQQQGFNNDESGPLTPTEEDEHPGKRSKREARPARRERITSGALSTR